MNKDLISIKPYRNVEATIFSLFVLVLLLGVYIFTFWSFFNSGNIKTLQHEMFTPVFVVILWLLIIASIIWSYKVAKQTGREPALWIIIGLIAGSIGLLILSLKDYNIKNLKIKSIILTTRTEFKEKLNNELDTVTNKDLKNKKRQEITQDFQRLLLERCSKEFTFVKVELLKEMVDKGILNKDTDLEDKARIIEKMESYKMTDSDRINWKHEWVENELICPACGTELDEESNNCLDCGLKVK